DCSSHAEKEEDPQPFALVKTTLSSVFGVLFHHGIEGSKSTFHPPCQGKLPVFGGGSNSSISASVDSDD
ncbi:MAG: hypothetical protein MK312_15095, partial [Roseibacillus sp.]|nr:hypothetical protein [Roseibacillus sp.]